MKEIGHSDGNKCLSLLFLDFNECLLSTHIVKNLKIQELGIITVTFLFHYGLPAPLRLDLPPPWFSHANADDHSYEDFNYTQR